MIYQQDKFFLDQLKDKDFYVQQAAVWALVKIGDKSVIPVLADLLKSNVQASDFIWVKML